MKKISKYALPIILILVAVILRFNNLGYSDFQGDEFKALYLPEKDETFSEYLLDQRKGPVQFIITFFLKFIDPLYNNQLLMRLPFAIAGVLAVIYFYKFVKMYYGKKIAFYASFFFATNGFLIAFSRIVQYQSYVILFMILALYVFSLSIFVVKWRVKGIYLGFIFWAISVLSHYDGLSIAPFVAYILFVWLFRSDAKLKLQKRLVHLIASILIFSGMLLSFYIPFVLTLSDGTLDYWNNRLSGGGGKISSSIYLFQVYHPIYVYHFYYLLFGLGFLRYVVDIIKPFINRSPVKKAQVINILGQFKDKLISRGMALLLWFACSFVLLEIIVNIPGTHIYTYLIPAMIIMAFGVLAVENITYLVFIRINKKLPRIIFLAGTSLVFVFMFLQSYAVFVDNTVEYPWKSEKFLVWEFPEPSPIFHLSIFGFPYHRHWEDVGEYVRTSRNNGFYSTNERTSITRNHIPFSKDTDSAGHYVLVIDPQSFTNTPVQDKAEYYSEKYEPVRTFYKRTCVTDLEITCKTTDEPVLEVYFMPEGDLNKIKEMEETGELQEFIQAL